MNIKEILEKIKNNSVKGSVNYYKPLSNEESELVRQYYRDALKISEEGGTTKLYNRCGTLISTGYIRIVIGDYGSYVEISPEQIILNNIENKWPGKPKRPVKYIWMQTKDSARTKIYFQIGKVRYADYMANMYYVDTKDINEKL